MNGMFDNRIAAVDKKTPKNYKLLTDPCLIKGAQKIYRYDGVIPNDPTHPNVIPRDPRSSNSRFRARLDPVDLPVPRLKIFFIC